MINKLYNDKQIVLGTPGASVSSPSARCPPPTRAATKAAPVASAVAAVPVVALRARPIPPAPSPSSVIAAAAPAPPSSPPSNKAVNPPPSSVTYKLPEPLELIFSSYFSAGTDPFLIIFFLDYRVSSVLSIHIKKISK